MNKKNETETTQQTIQTVAVKNQTQQAQQVQAGLRINTQIGSFTDTEVVEGQDVGTDGYVQQYPYVVSTRGDKFIIRDNLTNTVVRELPELHAIVFFAHPVYRLHQGTVNGLIGNMRNWSDDDKRVVAQSYDSPFGRDRKSRGNFDLTNHGRWLDDPDMRRNVHKRQYLIIALPGILPQQSLALLTLGGTSLPEFQRYLKILRTISRPDGQGVPLPFVVTELELEQKTNEAGEQYYGVKFSVAKNDKGDIALAVPSVDKYRQHILPVLHKIIDTHKYAVERAEQSAIIDQVVAGKTNPVPDPANLADFGF